MLIATMATRNAFSRVKSVWKTMFRTRETPREIQERNDLYKIALAVTYNDIRRQTINSTDTNTASNATTNTVSSLKNEQQATTNGKNSKINQLHHHDSNKYSNEELGTIYDQACDLLDDKKIYDMSLRALRRETQYLIRPQLMSLLQVFSNTESMIPSNTQHDFDSKDHVLIRESNMKRCCDVLYEEQNQTLDLLEQYNTSENAHETKHQEQSLFLHKKSSAIQTIADFYEWEHFYFDSANRKVNNDEPAEDINGSAGRISDEFGYIQSKDEEVNNSIRYYQMVNLSRSALIRQQIGYSVISLKSSLPSAGRGVFLDGTAPAGSIISFFPGDIWPKEFLVNSKAISPYFENDPKHHLSLRYDDIVLDCRKSPYTVLDDDTSNAFAIAHIVNHPSKYVQPNCGTMPIDFLDNMNLKEQSLHEFVPNTYKKKPMMLGPQVFDEESIMMHSLGLFSSRDIENEELFYDYRFSPGPNKTYPAWYHICNEEEVKNRWYRDSE